MNLRSIPVILGLMGLVAAISLGAVAGRFLPWHLGLGALSVVSMAGGLAWLQDVNWRATLASVVYSVFFVLSAALIYLITANRYQRFDLTRDRVHSLDKQTLSVLAQLPSDDRFLVQAFVPNGEHAQLGRFLESYRRIAPMLSYQLVDPARDIEIVGQMASPPRKGDIIVVRQDADGNVVRRINDVMGDAQYSQRENIFTNAIAKTLLDERIVYHLTGHGERPLEPADESISRLAELVTMTSSPVMEYRLLQGPVPDNAAALMIIGPLRDLFDPELEMLQQYLNDGGKLLVLLDPRAQVRMPNIEQLLGTLGLRSPNGLIVDPLMAAQTGSSFTPLVQLNRHPISEKTDRSPIVLGQARPFFPADKVDPAITMEALLASSEQTWYEPFDDLRSVRRPVPPQDSNDMGRKLAGVTVQKPTKGGRFGNNLRVVLVGDSDAFVDKNLDQNTGAANFFLASLAWLREERELIYVPPKILTTTPVNLTSTHFWTLMGLFLLMSAAVTLGGTAWTVARRRSR